MSHTSAPIGPYQWVSSPGHQWLSSAGCSSMARDATRFLTRSSREMLGRVMGGRAPMYLTKGAIGNLRRILAAGGRVAIGTDYGGSPGEVKRLLADAGRTRRSGHRPPLGEFQLGLPMLEMELMQEASMTPLQIVVAATKNGAFACGNSGEIGIIEPGQCADILVVNGNPLDDLHSLLDVQMVLKNGYVVRGEEHMST